MSLSFNCGQYEGAFDSKRMQNWENRNYHRQRPLTKTGYTQIISNNRGHLLPSIPRSARSPWGTFVGTWDLPKKLPGNKQTDPMARSAEAHFRQTDMKSEADTIIYGHNKLRRPKAGQPLAAMPTKCDPPVNVEATNQVIRSGAANPIVKGTPQRRATPVIAPSPPTVPQNMMDIAPTNVEIDPQLVSTPQPLRMTPVNVCSPPMHNGIDGFASPKHSPLPQLPGSPLNRGVTPQIATPKPASPAARALSANQNLATPQPMME